MEPLVRQDHGGSDAAMTSHTTLTRVTERTGPLEQVLRENGQPMAGAVVFLSTPERFIVGRLTPDGGLAQADGELAHLDSAFEVRAFDGQRELRWQRTAGDAGRLAVVSEDEDATRGLGQPIDAVTVVDRRELLWGQVVDRSDGWTATFEARVGRLDLPVTVDPAHRRVRLRVREYLASAEPQRCGNVYVAEERLVGLEGCESDA